MDNFLRDTLGGLTVTPKRLNSKYFYDAEGDKIFEQIMSLHEYYLTGCEYEILSQQADEIASYLAQLTDGKFYDLVELGCGNAVKTRPLIHAIRKFNSDLRYYPIDISKSVIDTLVKDMTKNMSAVEVHGLAGDYMDMLEKIPSGRPKVILFLGSTIGNFEKDEAVEFCKELKSHMSPGDVLIVGFDLKKNPHTILSAYNDMRGVTKRFNLNLLNRINRELDGNFDTCNFLHYPVYNPEDGSCRSYLVSTRKHDVSIGGKVIHFDKDEPIRMEISQKYSETETEYMAEEAGFIPAHHYFDSRGWFMDAVWTLE
jgi:dimethylhistidine N-methyltransferase